MKTYIFVNNQTKAVDGVGRVYHEDGSLVKPLNERAEEVGADQAILEHAQAICPAECTARLVELGEMPGNNGLGYDKHFLGAWVDDGGLSVDMPKAREIHMDRIRVARDKKLEKLDIEQLKGNDVSAEKQALRDIPETFDLTQAATPEELKALWPANL